MAKKHCNNVTSLLVFFCILFSAGIFLANIAEAFTIKVPDTYPNIQAAINAASAKDVIWVAEGIYNENIVLKADVKLEGGWKSDFSVRNWDDWPSIIDGGGRGSVVIGANKATLDGFSITNGDAEWGGGDLLGKWRNGHQEQHNREQFGYEGWRRNINNERAFFA
jgi:hypothetical protein